MNMSRYILTTLLLLLLSVSLIGSPLTTQAQENSLGGELDLAEGNQSYGAGVSQNGYSYTDSAGSNSAAGVGACGAGLLQSALTALGISKATSLAGQARTETAGAAGFGSAALAVPVADIPAHQQRSGQAQTDTVPAISSNAIFGIEMTELTTNNITNCIARAIARAALQHVTTSVVNWARSGFNGMPTFVSDPTAFFTNVADSAAGQYLASSDLAFLCSPFSLQVKIAIANSYSGANNSGMQCTLTGAANNIENFMNNFSEGGWPAFISMTTNPSNQPFGAYIQGSAGLNRAIEQATARKQNQLSLSGGFLDLEEYRNCKVVDATETSTFNPNKHMETIYDSQGVWVQTKVCDIVTVTPGKLISDSISKAVGTNIDSLNAAKHFDEIISALITGLIQKVVIGAGGLLGNGTSYGSQADFGGGMDSIAYLKDQILGQIPSYEQNAATLESIFNQNIAAIEPVMTTINSALSCLNNANGYTGLTGEAQAKVTQDLATVQSSATSLQSYLTTYQNSLANVDSSLGTLAEYETDVQGISSTDLNALNAAVIEFTNSTLTGLPDAAAITAAYEDQAGLQGKLAEYNSTIPPLLTDCQALNVPLRTPPPPSDGSAPPPPAPSCLLSITPNVIEIGATATLSWMSTNATAGSIDQEIGAVAPTGSASVTPGVTGTITYIGTFTGAGGSASCQTSITVTPPPPPDDGGAGGG